MRVYVIWLSIVLFGLAVGLIASCSSDREAGYKDVDHDLPANAAPLAATVEAGRVAPGSGEAARQANAAATEDARRTAAGAVVEDRQVAAIPATVSSDDKPASPVGREGEMAEAKVPSRNREDAMAEAVAVKGQVDAAAAAVAATAANKQSDAEAETGGAGSFRAIGSADGSRAAPHQDRPGQPPQQETPTDTRDLGPAAQNETLPPPTPKRGRSWDRQAEPGFSTDDASTFAIDVDSGSWAFARQALRNGRRPAVEAVRVEEFINAFHYRYAAPNGDAPLGWDCAYGTCPWNPSHGLLRVGLQAKEVAQDRRPATNLVLLIDTSGSMCSDERLPLLQEGFARLVDQLDEHDSVAIVTYAGNAGVAMPPTSGSDHRRIRDVIAHLTSGGGTNGSGGIRAAYDLARRSFIRGGQNRVLLATDGDFNLGTTDHRELEDLIRHEAASGVLLTVLGVGNSSAGDRTMEHLADCGNGVYSFLDNAQAADRAFGEQLTANLVTVAKDAKIQVFFNPAVVQSWRLVGYENRQLARRDFNDDRVDGGEVGAGHRPYRRA